MSSPRLARLELIATAALFSTGGAAIKMASFTSWQVASLRSGVAAVVVLALLPAARRRWSGRVLAVGACYAATMILFVTANKLTTAASTIYLQSTAPLYILFLGPWLLGERLRRRDLLYMLALAGGLGLLLADRAGPSVTAPQPALGNALALLSGLCWALTVIGLRWMGRGEDVRVAEQARRPAGAPGAPAAVAAGNLIAFAVCLPPALPLAESSPADWGVILYLGSVQIGLAYILLTRAIRWLPAFEASLLLLVEPVLNPLWAWWLLGEVPGPWSLAGGAVVLGATLVKTVADVRGRRYEAL